MSINFKPGTIEGETIVEGGITWEWDGEKWNRVNVSSNDNAGVIVSDNAPKYPETGQLWFNSRDSELTLYIYYDGVWVPAAPDSPKA